MGGGGRENGSKRGGARGNGSMRGGRGGHGGGYASGQKNLRKIFLSFFYSKNWPNAYYALGRFFYALNWPDT